ncbi:hypothetical protein [Chengkuizengella sediminis]|uniref:hypothetical protein n=1 Tax=Chengkuizengella sediminis TaxID=1885917 RepID=UPI001389ACF6|nr:hypothetical protein [Chengkuizengella sediminis]NDI36239.1 hypothetical protein [Chengkuizengella sediminis]
MGKQNIVICNLDKGDGPYLYELDKLVWNEENSPMVFNLDSLEEFENIIHSDKYFGFLVVEKDCIN